MLRPNNLAVKSHISLPISILISMPRPTAKRALMPLVILPRLIAILEHHRIIITSLRLDFYRIRQMARNTQTLSNRINILALHTSNDFLLGVVNNDVECVLVADAVFVALVLNNVHGAPAWCEAWGGVDGLEDGEAEGGGADFGDAAFVGDGAGSSDCGFFTEITVLAFGVFDDGLHVHCFPVVEVGELEDGVVEAVLLVAVFAACFAEGDGDWMWLDVALVL
jgi:hypothetical protein